MHHVTLDHVFTKQCWVTRILFYDLTTADSFKYPNKNFHPFCSRKALHIPRACQNGTSLKVQSPKATVNLHVPHPENILFFLQGWGMFTCSHIWGWVPSSRFLVRPQCSLWDFLVFIFRGCSVLCMQPKSDQRLCKLEGREETTRAQMGVNQPLGVIHRNCMENSCNKLMFVIQ